MCKGVILLTYAKRKLLKGGDKMCSVNIRKLVGKIAEKGYTKTSFAREIGVSRETLRSYLKDYNKIPYDVLSKMVSVLECTDSEAMSIFFTQ